MIHRKTKIIAGLSLTACIVSLALCIGFAYLVLDHKHTLVEELTAVAVAQSRRASFDELVAIAKNSESERTHLKSFLLEEENIIEFLALIEAVAREQGVEVKTSNLTVVPLGAFEELTLTLSLKGSYGAILHTLRLLETIPYQSRISAVQLSQGMTEGVGDAQKEEGWSALIEMHITKYRNL